jgi:hypothetical protein
VRLDPYVRPLLPSDVGVSSGILISASDDAQSGQQDIVIYDKRIIAPFLFQNGLGVFPVESVLFTIEVKSCLTATELRAAHCSAERILSLRQRTGHRDNSGAWVDKLGGLVAPLIFALDTDLSPNGQTEVERYKRLFSGTSPALIRGICVVGKGYWAPTEEYTYDFTTGLYEKADGSNFAGNWHEVRSDQDYNEVLYMLSAIHGLWYKIATTRGRPPLGDYL